MKERRIKVFLSIYYFGTSPHKLDFLVYIIKQVKMAVVRGQLGFYGDVAVTPI